MESDDIIERGPEIIAEARRIVAESHLACEEARTIVITAHRLADRRSGQPTPLPVRARTGAA